MIITDYLKAVRANKYLLAGYIGLLATGMLEYTEHLHDKIALDIATNITQAGTLIGGAFALIVTQSGKRTVRAYRKIRDWVNETGGVGDPPEPRSEMYYCDIVGVRAALREAGLEHLLDFPQASQGSGDPCDMYPVGEYGKTGSNIV